MARAYRVPVEGGGRRTRLLGLLFGVAAVAVVVLVMVAALSSYQVDVGEAAVIIDPLSGKIVDVVFGPAFRFKAPWQETKIVPVSVQTVLLEDEKALVAVTRDGARVPVEIQVRYEVRRDPAAVKWLVEKYPEDPHGRIKREVIERAAYEAVRSVIGKYNLVEIVPKIKEISDEIAAYLRQLLLQDPSVKAAIDIVDITVKTIDIPKELSQAILRKLTAQQEAEAAKYEAQREIIRAQMEAQKRVIAANATAMQQVIQATAEARRRVIEANATATKLLVEAMGRARALEEQYRGVALAIKTLAKELNVSYTEAAEIYYRLLLVEVYREVLPKALQNARIIVVGGAGNLTLPIIGLLPLLESGG